MLDMVLSFRRARRIVTPSWAGAPWPINDLLRGSFRDGLTGGMKLLSIFWTCTPFCTMVS